MERAAKMMNVVVAGRMARMKVRVTKPARISPMAKTFNTVAEAMRLAGEAELATRARSDYRNALIN